MLETMWWKSERYGEWEVAPEMETCSYCSGGLITGRKCSKCGGTGKLQTGEWIAERIEPIGPPDNPRPTCGPGSLDQLWYGGLMVIGKAPQGFDVIQQWLGHTMDKWPALYPCLGLHVATDDGKRGYLHSYDMCSDPTTRVYNVDMADSWRRDDYEATRLTITEAP